MQAFIYTTIVQVDVVTLFAMIAAAVLGAWLGAGVVASWPRQKVQVGMGAALLGARRAHAHDATELFPGGGDALGVRGVKLVLGVAVQLPARRADDARASGSTRRA